MPAIRLELQAQALSVIRKARIHLILRTPALEVSSPNYGVASLGFSLEHFQHATFRLVPAVMR